MKSTYIPKIEEENLIQYMDKVNLSDRDKEIARAFIEDKPTYRELGEKYGISHERIRQIIIKFAQKAHHYYKLDHK
ncbi:MAG: hypothetical protein K6E63_07205 [Lachnospiraceae bacterium]|nr:hypothetical protein [Lachnospiraceae bacterium]